jgi:pilus assembly protein CpaF
VTAITEVQGMEGETVTLQNLFQFHFDRVEADRTVVGRLEPTGLRPGFLGKFERHGIEVPEDLFGGSMAAMFGAGASGAAAAWRNGNQA